MHNSILQLEKIILTYAPLLKSIDEQTASYKLSPDKWSKKELIGHLIDSAQNNVRRFIVGQYEDRPCIKYAQDHWVAAAGYQNYPLQEITELWKLFNLHLMYVLKNIPAGMEKREVQTEALHSIEWLASDYNKHLLHHLHQILDLEPIAYP